jgi:hypothetical protein
MKSLEIQNQINLFKTYKEMESTVADRLLDYKFNLTKWVRNFNVASVLTRFFTPESL